MSDFIGPVPVPEPPSSGLTFPLISDYPYGIVQPFPIIEHRFGSDATLAVQRFQVGTGPKRFQFSKSVLSFTQRSALITFWNNIQGAFQTFLYNAPNPDNTTTSYTVSFETAPLSIQHLVNMCKFGMVFVEHVTTNPTYTISDTVVRFPSSALSTALLSQVQAFVPLIHIRVLNPTVPDIYLSDRRCVVGGQQYLPRILGLGEPGSDVIVTQDIKGTADSVTFTFGNADRVMSQLIQSCTLQYASIDLSFYHINSQILIQFWKGVIISWSASGAPTFTVRCTDGVYSMLLQYPQTVITRQCRKTYAIGDCPWNGTTIGRSAADILAAGGDPTKCDYFFNSPNGCLMHGMSNFFGGHPEFAQSIVIKDASQSEIANFFLGNSYVTSTSILSDSMYDNPLPEIWCNDFGSPQLAYYAKCIIAAVRDEGTYEDVLGIVGVGPIGAFEGMSVQTNADGYTYLVCPLADGFPPQGFQVNGQFVITGYHPDLGLRQILGTDPVNINQDFFSLGQGTPQRWDVPDPVYSNIVTGQTQDILPFAAGTSLCEVRYTKSATGGLQPTTAESHSMIVPIKQGLSGVIFDQFNNPTTISGLINPFWVGMNSYFRALGLNKPGVTTTEQLDSIVRSSFFTGTGTGAAEIADLIVPPLVGTGSELQWMFQGALTAFKPFRDWLTQILVCGMGYFTFEFGKLKVGCRYNAVPQSAFTLGNMLYRSLQIEPMQAAFEYLTIDFANVQLQYQEDMAEYQDKDHAIYFGRQGTPLKARQRQVGLSTMSQGLRSAATRVREEIGGILRTDLPATPYVEWDCAFQITFRTTILALEVEVGMVISVTSPDIPTYPGQPGGPTNPYGLNTWPYRVTRWQFHRDYSITITAKSVTDSMYALEFGPKPTAVLPTPLPVLFFGSPLGQWGPFNVQAASNDALYPNEWTFSLAQMYAQTASQTLQSFAQITGALPINQYIPGCGAPNIKLGKIIQSTTGGSLPGGTTVYVQVCAQDSTGAQSAPSDILVIHIPTGTNTNQFTISGILWPNFAGLTDYSVYASTVADDLIGYQFGGVLSGSAPAYTPTSIQILGPIIRGEFAVPNSSISTLRTLHRRLIHGGPVGAGVTAVSLNTITSSDIIDGTATDNWAGRVLAIIGRNPNTSAVPFQHFHITAFNPATGALTLDRDPVVAGILVTDAFAIGFLGYDNSATPYVLTDAGLSNITNGHTGEIVNDPNRIGNYVQVLAGTNRGASAKIVSNTSTSYTLDQPLVIDSTSFWVVVTANWETGSIADIPINNANPGASTTFAVDVSNYPDLPVLIGSFTMDQNGNLSADEDAIYRMLFVNGIQGTRLVTSTGSQLSSDRVVTFDTSSISTTSDTLAANITTTSQTAITLGSGAATVNGTYIQIGSEIMRIDPTSGGGGTASITILTRGALGTTAATHTAGATVTVPGALTFTLLPGEGLGNQELYLHKTSTDINYVVVAVAGGSGDTLDTGVTSLLLVDSSAALGQQFLQVPG